MLQRAGIFPCPNQCTCTWTKKNSCFKNWQQPIQNSDLASFYHSILTVKTLLQIMRRDVAYNTWSAIYFIRPFRLVNTCNRFWHNSCYWCWCNPCLRVYTETDRVTFPKIYLRASESQLLISALAEPQATASGLLVNWSIFSWSAAFKCEWAFLWSDEYL